jgi:DUF971 family protein
MEESQMAKIKVDEQKVQLTQNYLSVPTPTIELKDLGNNQSVTVNIQALEVKVVKVPQIDDAGNRIEGLFHQAISTVLYCKKDKEKKDEIILSLATSISRWAVCLLKSIGVPIVDSGYFALSDLLLKVEITRINKNNKNSYKIKTIEFKSKEVDLETLDLKDIREMISIDSVLLQDEEQPLLLSEGCE